MKKIYFEQKTNCPCRLLDSQRIKKYFVLNGWEIVNNIEDSDIIIVMSCGTAKILTFEVVNKLIEIQNKMKPGQKLILTGCVPETHKFLLKQFFKGISIPVYQYSKIDSLIKASIKFSEIPEANIISQEKYHCELASNLNFNAKPLPQRKDGVFKGADLNTVFKNQVYNDFIENRNNCFFIKVQGGCLYDCSYCVTKNAIGRLKSKPLEVVREEFLKGLKEGHKNIFITGENVDCYGMDIGLNLGTLLHALVSKDADYNLFLDNIFPRNILRFKDELKDIFTNGRIVGLNMPVQSGSNRILKLMRRFYSYDSILKIVSYLRKLEARLFMSTDIIVGFPGEDEIDFRKTIELINECTFDYVQVFPYNDQRGTESSEMSDKIPLSVIEERIKKAMKEVRREVRLSFYPEYLNILKKEKELLDRFHII